MPLPFKKTICLIILALILLMCFLLLNAGIASAQTMIVAMVEQDVNPNLNSAELIFIAFPVQGWYMVSLPVTVTNNSVSTLFPMAISALAWQNEQYVNVSTMETGKGYWLYIPQSSTAIISGTAISQFNSHYTPGWHLIGSVVDTVDFTQPNDTTRPTHQFHRSKRWNRYNKKSRIDNVHTAAEIAELVVLICYLKLSYPNALIGYPEDSAPVDSRSKDCGNDHILEVLENSCFLGKTSLYFTKVLKTAFWRNIMRFLEFKEALKIFTLFSINDIKKVDNNFHRRRLNEWQEKGYIEKIIRGYYIFSDLELNENVLFEIANKIHNPSYVSFEMAWSYYHLIPESVYGITSASTRRPYKYTTAIGGFIYRKIKPELFFGYDLVNYNSKWFKIASVEKTILDYFYLNAHITDFNTIRINAESFWQQIDENKLFTCLDKFSQKRLSRTINLFWEFMKNA